MNLIKVTSKKEIISLAKLAREIWFEHFPKVITIDQIEYMVNKFQSIEAITEQINTSYEYFLCKSESTYLGFCCIKNEDSKLFISKLYVHESARGKKVGLFMLNFIEETARNRAKKAIYLTVNKYNDIAVSFYHKTDFTLIREDVFDIGNGFIMDDYIFEKEV